MGDRRFNAGWQDWDAAVNGGKSPRDIVDALPNAALIALLASDGARHRSFERNIIATVLQNRGARALRHGSEPTGALSHEEWDDLLRAQASAASGQERARRSHERAESTRAHLAKGSHPRPARDEE